MVVEGVCCCEMLLLLSTSSSSLLLFSFLFLFLCSLSVFVVVFVDGWLCRCCFIPCTTLMPGMGPWVTVTSFVERNSGLRQQDTSQH